MNLFDLFEGAIDDLEARRIEDLEAKMDDLMARAKEATDPNVIAALRHQFAIAVAERNSYYKLNVEEDVDTNYTYTVFIDGTKEGTYGSKEEAKAVVKRKKEQAPGREYTIRPKSRTSMSSIKKFQRNRDRNIDEDDLITAEGFALDSPVNQPPMDPANKWKIMVRQLIADYIKNPRGLYHIAKQKGPNSAEAFAYNQIMHPTGKIALPHGAITFEGFQDFNKVEPYAVCLAGKPVKKFDYYEEARKFHDNWKQKLYREGDKAKADKITLMPLNLDEVYTPSPAKPFRNPPGFNKQGTGVGNKLAQQTRGELANTQPSKGTPVPAKAFAQGVLKDLKKVNVKDQGVAEDTGSWIVYDPETKQIRKRFKTHTAGKSYAQTHKLGFASSEYYFDRVKGQEAVAEDEQIDGMARGEVKEIIRNASTIQQALDQGVSLDGWMYSYVTTSNDHLNSVAEQIGNPDIEEAGMDWAAHKSTGPKFSGYLKGTDSAPTEFSNKSVGGMEEGIEGNMTVRSNPLSQPLRKRNYVAKNAQSSGAGKHNNNLKAAAARGQVKHKAKAFELDEMTDDEGAKLRKDAEAYSIKQMTAPKKVEPKKSFMQKVGDKQIGMVKGAWKGLTGQLEESDNFMTWAVRNGYNFTKDPAIYESARKKYKALVESKKKTLSEAKGLGKKVRVVSGSASGQTGTIGEIRNGAFKGAPKYYTIDLDNGGHVQVRKEALRLIQNELAESLKKGEYFIWTVYFDDGSSKRIKVTSDEFDPYAYYAKKNQVVVNVNYDWSIHQ